MNPKTFKLVTHASKIGTTPGQWVFSEHFRILTLTCSSQYLRIWQSYPILYEPSESESYSNAGKSIVLRIRCLSRKSNDSQKNECLCFWGYLWSAWPWCQSCYLSRSGSFIISLRSMESQTITAMAASQIRIQVKSICLMAVFT